MKDYDIPKVFEGNLSAQAIIRRKLANAEKPKNKYNVSLVRKVESDTGVVAADYREGCDTGNYPEKHNFDHE